MSSNPFRRPPMVDIPWGERERWWDRTTRRMAEAKLWGQAESLADLGELVAQFAEGKLLATPDHGGDRDPETVQIAAPLAHANRQGFVTGCSQPGEDGPVWEQRAAVQGWASPETVEKLRRLVAGTRLQIQVATERPRRTDYSNRIAVSRTVTPDGVHEHTDFGAVPGRRTSFVDLGRSDLTEGAAHVTIYDPEWGDHSLLWDRLAQPDWDSPEPPEPETAMPRHIPPGKEDLWRRQGEVNAEVTRLEKAIATAERKARELAAVLDPDDSIVEDADAEVARLYDAHDRATAVANRVYDERMAGLTSWIDTDPTAPICGQCHGAGRRPGTRGGDVTDACPGCRGWGRTYVEPVPVWNEQKQQWVNPATGRSVDLLADPEPAEAEVKPERSAMSGLWAAVRHPIDTIDRKITEAQTCPGCGCKPHEWRADCDCLRQGCVCAGAEQDDNPGWEREPGPDAAIVDAAGRNDGLPPAAKPYEPQRKRPQKTAPPTGGTTTGSTGGAGTPDVHDRRVGRWYDDKPITSTNTASTGGTMASIDEARAAIMAGIEKENEGLGAMQSAKASLEEAQNMLIQGTQGSNQSEADQAHAQLADAMSKIDEACQQVASTLQEFESVANRL